MLNASCVVTCQYISYIILLLQKVANSQTSKTESELSPLYRNLCKNTVFKSSLFKIVRMTHLKLQICFRGKTRAMRIACATASHISLAISLMHYVHYSGCCSIQ